MIKSYNLSGTWSFRLDNEKNGLEQHFENSVFEDTITLPGTTSEAQKGEPNSNRETGFLTEEYQTSGYAWYQKTLSIDEECLGKAAFLYLERTRYSYVWVDGKFVGSYISLCTAHEYDLTGFITTTNPVLTIMISNTDYPTRGGHLTSPDTQTNWNGIVGAMTLKFYESFRIKALRTDVNYAERKLKLCVQTDALSASEHLLLCVSALPFEKDTYKAALSGIMDLRAQSLCTGRPVSIAIGRSAFELELDLPDTLPLWDEYDPFVIRLTVVLSNPDTKEQDKKTTHFGIRDFRADGTHFTINGRKTFLRGKHDGMIFPLTGYAPMDVDSWLTVLSTAKEYGINHYRCHTCCPPDAAFLAADLLGIYYQPELPFWGSFYAKGDDGYEEAKENQEFLTEEGFRILDEFGNHPSFTMMSMGNELWGSPEAINELLGKYKAYDSRHLYAQGSNNFQWVPNIQPNDDFFSGVRFTIDRQIRGSYAMCDKPLGHVQIDRPCTDFNFQEAIHPTYPTSAAEVSTDGTIEIQYGTGVKRVKLTDLQEELIPSVPVLSHEIGQYETYPDFDEIEKYTGVLKARNFEIFRERLAEKGLLSMAKDYFHSSGALAVSCYKDELETALRTKDLAGFQILDIQDFSGQGTALVGVLDAFMDNKGLVSADKFRQFCSDAVIQAEFPSYTLSAGSQLTGKASLTWYRKNLPTASNGKLSVQISLSEPNGELLYTETLTAPAITENGYHVLCPFNLSIPLVSAACSIMLTISLPGTDVINEYELWIYPSEIAALLPADYEYCVTSDFVQAIKRTQAGAPAVLCLSKEQNPNSITGTYCTDFWCYPMFRSISESMKKEVPVGTMGLLIRNQHDALRSFPTHSHSTAQWWDVVMNSASTILDHTDIIPIVQTIDNFERNHRLGLIYEVRIGSAKAPLIVCCAPLGAMALSGNPVAAALLGSLVQYANDFSKLPAHDIVSMTEGEFFGLFSK